MVSKKGQGTTEYLILLSVIIVVALVVVGVMGWFPGLGTGITESQSKAYWKSTSPLAITDWDADSTNGVSFVVQNMTTDKIELTDILVDGIELDIADANIAAGATYTVPVDDSVSCTVEEIYSYDIKINYNVNKGIQNKTLTGNKPLIGTCS